MVNQFARVKPIQYIRQQISRDDYITSFRPEYPVLQFINGNLPQSAKILFFYIGKRGYYCDREYIPDSGGNLQLIIKTLRLNNGTRRLCEHLKNNNITHLFMNHAIVNQRLKMLTTSDKAKFLSFMQEKTKRLKSLNGYSIYNYTP